MDIEIYSGDTKVIIDREGAWITNVSNLDGDILYPKRRFTVGESTKYRGGCHVCVPQFGPDISGELEQHGFGRQLSWDVVDQERASVTLQLTVSEGLYAGLVCDFTVTVGDNSLGQQLTLRNEGSRPLRISPAFHPYFALDSSKEAILNGEKLVLDELHDTHFKEGARMLLKTNGRVFTLESDNLPVWSIWTDELAPYVCVEPTTAGFAFNESPKDDEYLAPAMSRQMALRIKW